MDERRLALVRSLPSREEQMDICSSVARTRTARGDFAGAVAAADLGDELGAGERPPLAGLARAEQGRRALLVGQVGRGDPDVRGLPRRSARRGHRRPSRPPVAPGPDAGRGRRHPHAAGETEAADRLERRLPGSNPHFDLVLAQALLGAGEAELALERSTGLPFLRPWARAIRAESLAMLGRWDDFDAALDDIAALPGVAELPARRGPGRPRAWDRRRRGRPGPGDRDVRAAGVRVRARPLPRDRRRGRGGEGRLRPDGRRAGGGEGRPLMV